MSFSSESVLMISMPKIAAQRTHVRVVGNDANLQNERVAKNGDIDLRDSEGVLHPPHLR